MHRNTRKSRKSPRASSSTTILRHKKKKKGKDPDTSSSDEDTETDETGTPGESAIVCASVARSASEYVEGDPLSSITVSEVVEAPPESVFSAASGEPNKVVIVLLSTAAAADVAA